MRIEVLDEDAVVHGRASMTLARNYIVEMIDLDQLSPGDRLPSAQQLSERIGVSRPVVLEALHELERDGRVRVRKGPPGVRVLTMQDADIDLRRQWVHRHAATILEMANLREIVEPAFARLAATRGVAHDQLRRLRELTRAMEEGRQTLSSHDYRALDTTFHRTIAQCCGGAAFDALEALVRRWVAPAFEFLPPAQRRRYLSDRGHRAILDAIEVADLGTAEEAARDHLRATNERLRVLLTAVDHEVP